MAFGTASGDLDRRRRPSNTASRMLTSGSSALNVVTRVATTRVGQAAPLIIWPESGALIMADNLTPERRSWQMSRVGGRNTKPELRVRRVAHALGLWFRLHRTDLPGRPDLVFPKHKTVVFVHGCFWHRHANCRRATMPATRTEYWKAKFAATEARDARTTQHLQAAEWRVIVIWECDTTDAEAVERALSGMLHPT